MMIVKHINSPLNFQENNSIITRIKLNPTQQSYTQPRSLFKISNSLEGRLLVDEFNPKIPIEKAITPPSSWYTSPSFNSLELDRIFYKGWQAVGMYDYVYICVCISVLFIY